MKPLLKEFLENRNPQRGESNAQETTNPFWVWCIENMHSGYGNNEEFGGECSLDVGPCWSFDRFGQSKTTLPDGRTIFVGGEHEDGYDPDFYIYNDVVIADPNGEITIYGYPEDVFPPTDFHTATLIGNELILIGSLSYLEKRKEGHTQVLRLNLENWTISPQTTTNMLGWISKHQAEYHPDQKKIRITELQRWTKEQGLSDEFSTWELNIETWQWECLEKKNWRQFRLSRSDDEMNNLWNLRNSIDMKNLGIDMFDLSSHLDDSSDEETAAMMKESLDEMQAEEKTLLEKTDLSLLPSLYLPRIPHSEIPELELNLEEIDDEMDLEYNHHRIEVDGIIIRFIEESYEITMRIEGELPEKKIEAILSDVCKNLSILENTEYRHQEIS